MIEKIKNFVQKNLRVLRVSRKPSTDEFTASAKICALGILLIGAIGFILYIMFHLW